MAHAKGIVKNEVGSVSLPTVIEISVVAQVAHEDGSLYPVTNIYHYRGDASNTSPAKGNVLNAFAAAVHAAVIAAIASADYDTVLIGGRWVDDPTDEVDTIDGDPAVGSGDTLPLRNAVVFNLRGGVRGKVYRGRKFYSPILESLTTKDELTTTTNYLALGVALLATLTDSDGNIWYPIVLNVSSSDLTASPAVMSYFYVTTATLNLNIGELKRRKEKRTLPA